MNLNEYQMRSADTDKKTVMRDMRLLYYAGQLSNEAAELRGKVWKTYRDLANYQEEAIAEVGDILWYATQIASFCQVKITEYVVDNNAGQYASDRSDGIIDDVVSLKSRCDQVFNVVYAQSLVEMHPDDKAANDRLSAKDIKQLRLINDIVIRLQCCCNHLGVSIEEVAERNYVKLSKRAENRVIEGNGDDRE